MVLTNRSFQNSLHCLLHPLTLLSIALLFLNDHFLKAAYPSWLTGKLSDVSGLFFFPFLTAASLGLITDRFHWPVQRTGLAAFGLTFLGFTLLKTSMPVNQLITALMRAVFNSPVSYAFDPSDLIGLAALPPAWMIWRRPMQIRKPGFGYLALSLASVAVLATSPRDYAVTSVTDLEYLDGVVYAIDTETFGGESYPMAKSIDGGLTWERVLGDEAPISVQEKVFPVIACPDRSSESCYRVLASGKLQITYDHQENWYNVFDQPGISVLATDAVIIQWDEKEYILVAIGESGVLRKQLFSGNWEIINVINATSR